MNLKLITFIVFCVKYVLAVEYFEKFHRVATPPDADSDELGKVKSETFQQDLDHFTVSGNRTTWSQRYFVNDEFYKAGKVNPAFLLISGQNPASPNWLAAGAIAEYAEEHGAMLFMLEHRFYGESQPFDDLATPQLRYLTSRQAVQDIGNFIFAINGKYNLGKKARWILFGGGYGGSLAVWSNIKFPHLITGTVSSGALLEASPTVPAYYVQIAKVIRDVDSDCGEAVKQAFFQIESLIESKSTSELMDTFSLCVDFSEAKNDSDVALFFQTLALDFDYAVHSRDQNLTQKVCALMTDKAIGSEISRLAEVHKMFHGSQCLQFLRKEKVAYLQKTEANPNVVLRQKMWQSCTELGWFYPGDDDMFGTRFPADVIMADCELVFGSDGLIEGLNATFVLQQTVRTNAYHGGNSPYVKNGIFVVGHEDPHKSMGIDNIIHPSSFLLTLEGVSHYLDMYASDEEDSENLTDTRDEIKALIRAFLGSEVKGTRSLEEEEEVLLELVNDVSSVSPHIVLLFLSISAIGYFSL